MAAGRGRLRVRPSIAWAVALVTASVPVVLSDSAQAAPSYAETIVADAPVAFWRLGETSGTSAVDEIATRDGIYNGTPTLGVAGALTTDADTAVTFDGTDSVTITNYKGITGSDARSVEFFLRTSDPNGSIIEWGGSGQTLKYHVRLSNGKLRVAVGGGTGTGRTNLADGTWHHVVITMPAGGSLASTLAYVDGGPETFGGSGAVNTAASIDVSLGRAPFESRSLNGSLDEVALYDKVLTAGDADEHHAAASDDAGVPTPAPSETPAEGDSMYPFEVAASAPLAYWRLGEASGTIAIDEIATRDGTYNGTPALGVIGALPADANTAVAFDGTDAVTIPGFKGITGSNARSLELFLRTSDPGASIVEWGGSGQTTKYHVRLYNGRLRVAVGGGSGTGTSNLANGAWHHVAITMPEGGSLANTLFYVDGAPETKNGTGVVNTAASIDMSLARAPFENRSLNGSLDEVALYDRVLSADEIAAHYGARLESAEPPPPPQCSDELDNDGDGATDHPDDTGCVDANDDDEVNPACSDGTDNDGDGATDHPDDTGCLDANDDDEVNPACSDGTDNDGDGATDHPEDTGCEGPNDDDERNAIRIAAAGDIACDPADPWFNGGNQPSLGPNCHMWETSELVMNGNFDGVLALGDLQYEAATLENFMASYELSWGRFKNKTYPVFGNHEYKDNGGTTDNQTDDAGGYKAYWGERAMPQGTPWYSFDIGNWHFIALDSECRDPLVGGCDAGSPQGTWLAEDLAASTQPCTLAYWHRPRFSSDHKGNQGFGYFWKLLYDNGAELVLNGHKHHYERFVPLTPSGAQDDVRGIVQIISGAGGKELHDDTPWQYPKTTSVTKDADLDTFGILDLTLTADAYSFEFVRDGNSGDFTDSGAGTCH